MSNTVEAEDPVILHSALPSGAMCPTILQSLPPQLIISLITPYTEGEEGVL